MRATKEFQERVGRIEGLVERLESTADPALRRTVRELIESLMELHGAGLERILELASDKRVADTELVPLLSHDELISSLLVLHGLHPEDFETRVRRGIDKMRPALRSQGARVEVIAIGDATVKLKIIGSGRGNFETAVREALLEVAPDAAEVSIDGGSPPAADHGFVPLASLRAANGSPAALVSMTHP